MIFENTEIRRIGQLVIINIFLEYSFRAFGTFEEEFDWHTHVYGNT